jgi:hypothetical protein
VGEKQLSFAERQLLIVKRQLPFAQRRWSIVEKQALFSGKTAGLDV